MLKACIPGCESIEKVSDTEYKVAMTAAVGPVKAKFSGKLLLSDLNPPQLLLADLRRLRAARPGSARAAHRSAWSPEAGGTSSSYTAKATVGGKLAQVGSRLIDGVAQDGGRFLLSLQRRPSRLPAPGGPETLAAAPKKPVPHWVWVVLAVVVAALIGFWVRHAR